MKFNVTAKNEVIDQILKNVFLGLPNVNVRGSITGDLPSIGVDIESNLGPELQKGFEKQIAVKIAEARAQIEQVVQKEVGKLKAQIDSEVAKLKNQVDGEIKKLQAQADAQKKQAEAKVNQAKKDGENSAKQKVEDEIKKAAEELKKKFGL